MRLDEITDHPVGGMSDVSLTRDNIREHGAILKDFNLEGGWFQVQDWVDGGEYRARVDASVREQLIRSMYARIFSTSPTAPYTEIFPAVKREMEKKRGKQLTAAMMKLITNKDQFA